MRANPGSSGNIFTLRERSGKDSKSVLKGKVAVQPHKIIRAGITVILLLVLTGLGSCRGCSKKSGGSKLAVFGRDSSLCEVDSISIGEFAEKYHLKDTIRNELQTFYARREGRSAWTNNRGVNEYAGSFLNLLNQQKADAASGDKLSRLENLYNHMVNESSLACHDSLLRDMEILLSATFFEYARRSWSGMSDDVRKQVGWFIVRQRMDYPQLVENFLKSDKEFREPAYRQYSLLKEWLQKYAEIEKEGTWPRISKEELSGIGKGDTSPVTGKLFRLLQLTGDVPKGTTGNTFDSALERGLISYQQRHGLDTTGTLGDKTINELTTPLHERVQQIIINMERSRWVASESKGSYIVVNIPLFNMHVYENEVVLWSSDVIVGKSNPVNKTVIFNDSIELIVFSPHWNIPINILKSEILPEVKKSKKYLEEKNMEVVDARGKIIEPKTIDWDKYTNSFPYIVRERPGPENSLGKVKFLFPNPYDIYMHDTPARTLFSKTDRTFSHGCIRVSEPEKFAVHLLRDNPDWPVEKIRDAMNGDREIFVKLKKKVPVFIAYFTAWVDRKGRLNFGRDIYGHDESMRSLLFVN